MRHVVKYILFLAILMSGFYMARKFRPSDEAAIDADATLEIDAVEPAFDSDAVDVEAVEPQLPVAALVDIDKSPTWGMFDSDQTLDSTPDGDPGSIAGGSTVREQPTVRSPSKATAKNSPQAKRSRRDSGSAGRQRDAEDDRQRSTDRSADETQDHAAGRPDRPSFDDPLPEFAEQYQPWLDPLDESAHPERAAADIAADEQSPGQSASSDGLSERLDGPRRHEIVVGDTLELLAEKYFGDRERQLEIYEANRDVLFHPRLLPIGVEISIPGSIETAMADVPEEPAEDDGGADPWGDADEDGQVEAELATEDPWGMSGDGAAVEEEAPWADAYGDGDGEQQGDEDVAGDSHDSEPAGEDTT
jgi:nucleoid-associated protein YgaU